MANEIVRRLRKTMTRHEVKLWVRLRELRSLGIHFRRQSPICNFIVDFECRRSRIIVELDGGQHARASDLKKDRIRDETLQREGYKVLRFWNNEIDKNLEGILETIVRERASAPHPAASRPPSPKGEG